MRLILLMLLLLSISFASRAQPDTSYHLLWYTGKKLRPNVLLTPAKDTVSYNPSAGVIKVTSQSPKGKAFDIMLSEVNSTSKRAKELVIRLSNKVPKPVLPVISTNIAAAYSDVERTYRKLLSNSLSLPDISLRAKTGNGIGGYSNTEDWDDIWDDAIKKMQDYRAVHANDNLFNVPEPPRTDFTYCYSCNTGAQDLYNKQVDDFIAATAGDDDTEMMRYAFGASRQAELLLGGEKRVQVQAEVVKTVEFIIQRLRKKVILLVDRYIDNAEQAVAVLQAALTLDRQMQLLGTGEPLPGAYMRQAFESYAKRIKRAMDEEDYPIALNLQLLISTDRQMQLTGSGFYEDVLNQALKFNQFKVNMNISAKTGSDDGGYLLAQLRGDNWFMAFPDSTCRLKWFLAGPYMNKLKMNLESADMRGNGGQIPYVGTKAWEAPASLIKLDFCNYETDTVIAYPFNAENFTELWQMPAPLGATNLQQVNGLFLSCFIDPERVKDEVAGLKNSEAAAKLQKEMAAKYQQYLKFYQNGTLNMMDKNIDMPTLNNMARSQELARGISEMVYTINPGRFIFTPTVHNKERVVVQDRLDGKVLFPGNTAIEYAFFHLRIEHDPNGPYIISL